MIIFKQFSEKKKDDCRVFKAKYGRNADENTIQSTCRIKERFI